MCWKGMGDTMPQAQETALNPAGEKHEVLIVDDSEDMLWAIGNVLELAGLSVDAVATGREAIDRLRESPDIKLVILDSMLPDKSGLSVLTQLKSNGCTASVIAISAQEDLGDSFLKAGAFAFMGKPFDIRELVRLCRHALNGNKAQVDAKTGVGAQ